MVANVKFSSLFSSREVICNPPQMPKDELLRHAVERLALERGIGNSEKALAAVFEREEQESTVIGPGLAVPHARLDSVEELTLAVVTSAEGLDYGDTGAEEGPVQMVVLILVPKESPAFYLQAISSLAGMASDPDFVPTAARLKTAEEVWRFFDRGGVVLPAFVCAGDIMNRSVLTVQETDTLETAIDMLVRHNQLDMPVVDVNGELVGVVTSTELLRVGLPDYILWMEDLSPIINFEPFAQVLRNEGKTWLQEIMTHDYAAVPEQAPAIQVAKEIMRRDARVAYVLRGKKLVGQVTIQEFVNKILRD